LVYYTLSESRYAKNGFHFFNSLPYGKIEKKENVKKNENLLTTCI
jgi:hypothetical protein